MSPTVTVVIPSFNYARFLTDAVESVWAQSVKPGQLIVSDDGSRDDSVEVARALAAKSPMPLEVIASGHVGLHESLNRSLRASTGELVAFLAADDRWTPQFLERQVAHFSSTPATVLAHCDFSLIDARGGPLASSTSGTPAARGDCLESLLRGTSTMRTGPVVRRETAMAFGGFDPTYPQEDWSFYLRCAARGPLGFSPEQLVERRIHGENSSVKVSGAVDYERALKAAAVPLLKELAPNQEVLDAAIAFHVGVLIRNSLYSGDFRSAARVLTGAAQHHPRAAGRLAGAAARGLASFSWDRTGRRMLSGERLALIEGLLRKAARL